MHGRHKRTLTKGGSITVHTADLLFHQTTKAVAN